jgi:hypothetical protein
MEALIAEPVRVGAFPESVVGERAMVVRKRRTQLAILVTTLAGAVSAAAVAGGSIWGVAVTVYLLVGLFPGAVVYLSCRAQFGGNKPGILEAVFFSNVLGIALLEGVAWILARSGVFSLLSTLALAAVIVAVALIVLRRGAARVISSGLAELVEVSWPEIGYGVALLGIALALLVPLLLLLREGYLIGADTTQFSLLGTLTATTGAWPNVSTVWQPFASNAVGPGLSMIYAVLVSATGVRGIYFAVPLALIPIVLTPLGLYVLIRRFTASWVVSFGVPLAWMVSADGVNTLFYNNLLFAGAIGYYPDSLLSLFAYVAAIVVLVDLLRGEGPLWTETILLAAAVLLVVLDNELTLFFLLLPLVGLGVLILWRRRLRWTAVRLGAVAAPSIICLPPYLYAVGSSTSISPLASGRASLSWSAIAHVDWAEVLHLLGFWGEVGLVVGLGGAGLAVLSMVRPSGRRRELGTPLAIVVLAAVGVLGFLLTFTPVGQTLIGPPPVRLIEFVGLPLAPVVAYLLAWPSRIRLPRIARAGVTVAVVAFLVASSAGGVSTAWKAETSLSGPAYVFTPEMKDAAEWISTHAPAGAVIAVDVNGGNNALAVMRDFTGHPVIVRPRSTLYASIIDSPSPTNLSAYYSNLVMTAPTLANAEAAYRTLALEYYVFQYGYSARQIEAFSLLAYLPEVYENSQVAVFAYEGPGAGGAPGFIPATAFCAASAGVVPVDIGGKAYSVAYSIPSGLNAISSSTKAGAAFNGSTVEYCLNIPAAGNYTVYVHRYTYQTSEYLEVSIDNRTIGVARPTSEGPNVGTPVAATLSSGTIRLSLTFEGTVGYADPIDYLVVTPA